MSLYKLSSEETRSQMIGPKYLTDLELIQTVFDSSIGNSLFLQKLNEFFCLINELAKLVADRLL